MVLEMKWFCFVRRTGITWCVELTALTQGTNHKAAMHNFSLAAGKLDCLPAGSRNHGNLNPGFCRGGWISGIHRLLHRGRWAMKNESVSIMQKRKASALCKCYMLRTDDVRMSKDAMRLLVDGWRFEAISGRMARVGAGSTDLEPNGLD